MRHLINTIKPRLMNLAFVLVYVAGFAVTALDVFVWRP